jgi:hypothetical protein
MVDTVTPFCFEDSESGPVVLHYVFVGFRKEETHGQCHANIDASVQRHLGRASIERPLVTSAGLPPTLGIVLVIALITQ